MPEDKGSDLRNSRSPIIISVDRERFKLPKDSKSSPDFSGRQAIPMPDYLDAQLPNTLSRRGFFAVVAGTIASLFGLGWGAQKVAKRVSTKPDPNLPKNPEDVDPRDEELQRQRELTRENLGEMAPRMMQPSKR